MARHEYFSLRGQLPSMLLISLEEYALRLLTGSQCPGICPALIHAKEGNLQPLVCGSDSLCSIYIQRKDMSNPAMQGRLRCYYHARHDFASVNGQLTLLQSADSCVPVFDPALPFAQHAIRNVQQIMHDQKGSYVKELSGVIKEKNKSATSIAREQIRFDLFKAHNKEVPLAKPTLLFPPGLRLTPNHLSLEQQTALLLEIQNLQTLHPGWVDVAPEGRLALQLGSFVFRYDKPMGIQAITPRPLLQGYTAPNWVQNCIVNVYDGKSDCIKPHIDSLWFGEHVEILSLGSPCTMLFSDTKSTNVTRVRLCSGDRLVLSGEARYRWTHEIQSQDIEGPRTSITLRSVNEDAYWKQARMDLYSAMPGVFAHADDAMDMAKYLKPKVA